jgi:polar amino acid transport system substrate-binding protein
MPKTRYLSPMTVQPSIHAKTELTPKGKLRVGINHSNFLLSTRDPVSGAYSGIVIDLATELARRLDVAFEVVGFENPGLMADAAQSDAWDIAFMGSEPARANVIAFSTAYLEIDAGYLVPPGSPIQNINEVDREGVRIALMDKSAYDLYLSRHIKHATLIRTSSIDASFEVFVRDQLEVLAGLKPRLTSDASNHPGARILNGRFTAIQQSIGAPKGRDAGAKFLLAFVEEIKATGMVEALINKHNVRGVSVAPAATPSN